MLGITDSAAKEFKRLIAESKAEGSGIRVFNSGGGCCGPSLGLDISEKGNDGDVTIEKDNLKIFIDPVISADIENATIDFVM